MGERTARDDEMIRVPVNNIPESYGESDYDVALPARLLQRQQRQQPPPRHLRLKRSVAARAPDDNPYGLVGRQGSGVYVACLGKGQNKVAQPMQGRDCRIVCPSPCQKALQIWIYFYMAHGTGACNGYKT